jgi:hypothetical protein
MTRKTKELDHEKLVTVFLGPLSDRHWLYLYMEYRIQFDEEYA